MKNFHKMGIEQLGRKVDGDNGSPLLYMALTVVSRQFGDGSSFGLMTLFYSRRECFVTLLMECFCVETPRACTTLPLVFELVDGVVEFPHRERRHCVLVVVVLVVILVHLRRRGVELLVELREHIHNGLSVVLVGDGFACVL